MMLLPRVSVDGEAADREQGEAQPDLEEAAVLADEAEVAKMPVNGKWELTFCVRRKTCPLLVMTLRRIAPHTCQRRLVRLHAPVSNL